MKTKGQNKEMNLDFIRDLRRTIKTQLVGFLGGLHATWYGESLVEKFSEFGARKWCAISPFRIKK